MGLSHEIDLKNFEKKFIKPGLSNGRGWFLNFLVASMIHNAKSLFIAVRASLGWLNNVSGLIVSVPINQRMSIF
jgi:hypothetical protein